MKEAIKKTAEEVSEKAEHYAQVGGGYQALITQVIQIGGKAMMSKKFTLAQAEQVTAMMLAAVTLAKKG